MPETVSLDAKRLLVLQHQDCVYAGCLKCNRVMQEGQWLVAVETNEGPYLVGQYPREVCCGEEVKIPFVFEEEFEAQDKMRNILKYIHEGSGSLRRKFAFYCVEVFIQGAAN